MNPEKLVLSLFDDLYNLRFESFLDRLAESIHLSMPQNAQNAVIPFTGEWYGREAVTKFLEIRADTTESKNQLRSISVSGQTAFVIIHAEGICKPSGQAFEIEDLHQISFDDNEKVISWKLFADLGPLSAAFAANLPEQLINAVKENDTAEVQRLINLGANVNARSDDTGLTLLMMAACQSNSQVVELLLNAGADIYTTDPYTGATALHKACQGGNANVGHLLLEAGAFIDAVTPTMGHTPIMDALWYKSASMIEELLKYSPNIETKTHYGFTLWDHLNYEASAQGTNAGKQLFAAIESLIYTYRDSCASQIEHQTLLTATQKGETDRAHKAILEGTVDLEERHPHVNSFSDGHTALLIACRDNQTAIVDLLLEAGAEVDSFDWIFKGFTIHKATYNGRADILKKLLSSSKMSTKIVNVQGRINGYSPLHDALWHGFEECARLLLDDPRCLLGLVGHDGKDELAICSEVFGANHPLSMLIKERAHAIES
jgi:ankyrin repeat protein